MSEHLSYVRDYKLPKEVMEHSEVALIQREEEREMAALVRHYAHGDHIVCGD